MIQKSKKFPAEVGGAPLARLEIFRWGEGAGGKANAALAYTEPIRLRVFKNGGKWRIEKLARISSN
jgi:hypothetical protein